MESPENTSADMELQKVTNEDLRRVAELANLDLTNDEEVSLLRDLNSILNHVAQLNELETASVPAMAQVNEVVGNGHSTAGALREDVIAPSLDRSLVMKSAPDSDGVFFRVPKVIER